MFRGIHAHSVALIKEIDNEDCSQLEKWIKICQSVNKELWLLKDQSCIRCDCLHCDNYKWVMQIRAYQVAVEDSVATGIRVRPADFLSQSHPLLLLTIGQSLLHDVSEHVLDCGVDVSGCFCTRFLKAHLYIERETWRCAAKLAAS